jgi:hypothetical protein
MTRSDVILQVYRCIRDALTDIRYAERSGNKVIYFKDDKKVTLSFRIKIEDSPVPTTEDVMP